MSSRYGRGDPTGNPGRSPSGQRKVLKKEDRKVCRPYGRFSNFEKRERICLRIRGHRGDWLLGGGSGEGWKRFHTEGGAVGKERLVPDHKLDHTQRKGRKGRIRGGGGPRCRRVQ